MYVLFKWTGSSAGQSNGLLSRGSDVRVVSGSPKSSMVKPLRIFTYKKWAPHQAAGSSCLGMVPGCGRPKRSHISSSYQSLFGILRTSFVYVTCVYTWLHNQYNIRIEKSKYKLPILDNHITLNYNNNSTICFIILLSKITKKKRGLYGFFLQ